MAVKKATTTDDVVEPGSLTDPAVVAKVPAVKTVKVTSPHGYVTEVPEEIVQALLDSGYTKK